MPFIPTHRSECLLVEQESIEKYPKRQQIEHNTTTKLLATMGIDEIDALSRRSKTKPIQLTSGSDCGHLRQKESIAFGKRNTTSAKPSNENWDNKEETAQVGNLEDRDTQEECIDISSDENGACCPQEGTPDSVAVSVSTANSILRTETKQAKNHQVKSLKHVRFDSLSTLYVFDDDYKECKKSKQQEGDLLSCSDSVNDVATRSDDTTCTTTTTNNEGSILRRCRDKYNVNNAWYSSQELKAFRAEMWLTVNWMVMNGIAGSNMAYVTGNQTLPDEMEVCSNNESDQGQLGYKALHRMILAHEERPRRNRKGHNRKTKNKNSKYGHLPNNHTFCARGVECRTPMGRIVKNKRRLDAMRAVLLYQDLQKTNQKARKQRQMQSQTQTQTQATRRDTRSNHPLPAERCRVVDANPQDNDDCDSGFDEELLQRIEIEVNAEALANVYGSYCEESSAVALALGRQDALAVGMKGTKQSTDSGLESVSESSSSMYSVRLSSSSSSCSFSSSSVSSSSESSSSSASSSATKTALPLSSPTSSSSPSFRRGLSLDYPKPSGSGLFDCPSLCDADDEDENESLEKLVSISHVRYPAIQESNVEQDEPQEQDPEGHQEEQAGDTKGSEEPQAEPQAEPQNVKHHPYKPHAQQVQQTSEEHGTKIDEEYSVCSLMSSSSTSSLYSVAISVSGTSCSSNSNVSRSGVEVELFDSTEKRWGMTCSSADSVVSYVVRAPSNAKNYRNVAQNPRRKSSMSSQSRKWSSPSKLLSCSSSSSTEYDELLASASPPPSAPSNSSSTFNSFDRILDLVSGQRDWW